MNDESDNVVNITVKAIKGDLDFHAIRITELAESFVLAGMQEQTGFVKHIVGSAAEDVWNDV